MRKRVLGAMVGAALVTVPLTSGAVGAQATVPGKATATTSATVLRVQLGADGALLNVRVLGDDSTSKNDPGDTNAALVPLTVTSAAVPALSVSTPAVSTASTGPADSKQLTPALPATPAATGTLTGTLSSVADADGARSSIDATLSNLAVVGGLVTAPSTAVRVGTDARRTAGTASRTVSVPEAVVLDLGAVLDGLGRPLASLPIGVLLGLLGELGLTLPVGTGTLDAATLETTIGELNVAIDQVAALGTGALNGTVCAVVDEALEGLPVPTLPALPGVPAVPGAPAVPAVPDATCTATVDTAAAILAQLRATLAGLLSSLLSLLDGAALLTVRDVNVGIVAKATDAVGTSVADVTASIGAVQIGGTALPFLSGLDFGAGAEVIDALADTVGLAVGAVLAAVDPDLGNLVHVELLQVTREVKADGPGTLARAGVIALRATITPPPLGALAAAVDGSGTGAAITSLGGTLPALSTGTADLESALGGVQALSGPSSVTVAELASTSRFTPGAQVLAVPPQTARQTLPRTGAETGPMVELAAALLVSGMALLLVVTRRRVAAS